MGEKSTGKEYFITIRKSGFNLNSDVANCET